MVRIGLIGTPRVLGGDGVARELRGQKPWALLARLLLSERPLSRRELSTELFPDAVDPLGSLRWCLAELRRALGDPDVFQGDPVRLNLPETVEIDVHSLEHLDLDDIGTGELLQGIDPPCGPEFEIWLLVVRQQVASRLDAELHRRTLVALARGRAGEAVRHADLAARRTPLAEGPHILLVKSLVADGRHAAALEHVERVEALFRTELRREPSAALRSAARSEVASAPPGVSASSQVTALIDAGRAALVAGAADAGVDCLRRATACAASTAPDGVIERLRATAQFELGQALVHNVRGFDDEGTVLLRQVAEQARDAGDNVMASAALAELGYAGALVGRRQEAASAFEEAEAIAGGDPLLMSRILAYQALNLTDWGQHAEAVGCFDAALRCARRSGDRRREGWALGLGAWGYVRAGMIDLARQWSADCLDLVHDLHWVSFEPFPMLVSAECDVVEGTTTNGHGTVERAFAMGCELQDPCWEGGAARVFAMRHAAAGDAAAALRWITEAHQRATRVTDAWAAMVGEILLTEAEIRRDNNDGPGAEAAAREAIGFAARTQLDGLLPRAVALIHRRP